MSTPSRRRDPTTYTSGWEIPVVVLGLTITIVALAALTGLGLAAFLAGGGWVWPHGLHTVGRTLGGLATGNPGSGLPPADATRAAGPFVSYLCVAVCEAVVITGSVAAALALARRLRNDGMATRRDAEQALGLSELRKAKALIRPDLYGRDADAVPSVDHAPTLIGGLRGRGRR